MLRTKDHKTGERGRQLIHTVHKVRKPRPDDPKHPGKAQQETLMAPNERSKKPASPTKTRLGPICIQPSGNNEMRQVKEVHNEATVGCRKCPKKYKTVYSRTRHEKKHHPAPHSAARGDYRPPLTARELGPNQSEQLHTSQEPGNDSGEDLAQGQKGEIAGSKRRAPQLLRSHNNAPDDSTTRQDRTSERPRRAGESTRVEGDK